MAYVEHYICISIEVICFFGVIILNAVIYEMMYLRVGGIQPFKRGFFCNDETIMKPFKPENLSFSGVLTAGIILSLSTITVLEIGNFLSKSKESKETERSDGKYVGPVLIPTYVIRMIHRMAIFGVGMTMVMVLCNVIALLSGRLRPHFLAICKPNKALYNCSQGYITADVCTGKPLQVKIARFSFPSGHTAITTYSMVFIALYLQASLCLRKYKLFRMVLQTGLIILGFAVGLCRLRDYRHHWLDVVAGAVIGILAASLVALKVIRVFNDKERQPREYLMLPEPDHDSADDEINYHEKKSKE